MRILLPSIFILGPILIGFALFPPWERIPLEADEDRIVSVSQGDFKQISFLTLLSNAFQIPFDLNLYRIHIVQQSFIPPGSMELTMVRFIFDEGSPEKYSPTSLVKWEDGTYEIPINGEGSFIYLMDDKFSFRSIAIFQGKSVLKEERIEESLFLPPEYEIYAKPYLPALAVKYILIFIFWVFLYASLITIWRYFSRIYKKERVQ